MVRSMFPIMQMEQICSIIHSTNVLKISPVCLDTFLVTEGYDSEAGKQISLLSWSLHSREGDEEYTCK